MTMFSTLFQRKHADPTTTAALPEQAAWLECIRPERLLQIHRDDIEKLRCAFSDETLWGEFIEPNLLAYAAMTARVPLAPHGAFARTDGLFCAGIAAAVHAVGVMESFVHPGNNIMRQAMLHSRLKTAALLAALFHFVPVLLEKIRIEPVHEALEDPFWNPQETSMQRLAHFCALSEPLSEYLRRQAEVSRPVQLVWMNQTARRSRMNDQYVIFLLPQLIDVRTLRWLTQAGPEPLIALFSHLTQSGKEDDPVNVAANLGAFAACEKEREALGARLGENLEHRGWESLLIGIIRTRVAQSWLINSKDSPLKLARDGLFLQWPDVCPCILQDLHNLGIYSMPNDPTLWAGMLLKTGITLPSRKGTPKCFIAVTPNAKLREAVKLNAEYFFDPATLLGLKCSKRDMEVSPDAATESGLPQLNRDLLLQKTAAERFTIQTREEASPQPSIWTVSSDSGVTLEAEADQYLQALTLTLTKDAHLARSLMLDEGILLYAEVVQALDQDFELLTLALLHADAIYHTDTNEPVWVDVTTPEHGPVHAIVVPGHFFTVHCFNGTGQVPMSYEAYFEVRFARRARPKLPLIRLTREADHV